MATRADVKTDLLYFIRAGEFVKIGRTSNLSARLVSIQTGCPFDIGEVVTIAGMGRLEREVHYRLAKHRARGEWFHWGEAVQREIDAQKRNVVAEAIAYEYLDECVKNGPDSPKATAIREDAERRLIGTKNERGTNRHSAYKSRTGAR